MTRATLLLLFVPLVGLAQTNLSITAGALHGAYTQNEVEAEAKYSGVRVSVGGIIVTVGKDRETGDPYVVLRDPSPYHGGSTSAAIKCRFTEAFNGKVAQLRKDSGIAIKGTVVGLRGSEVLLKDCSL